MLSKIVAGLSMTVIFLAIAVISALLTAIPVFLLWNWLMPELFHLPMISIVQALGLAVLASLLFKSNSGSKKADR